VRSQTDTELNESPAAQNDFKVINQLSRRTSGSNSAPGKLLLLDTRLLMGGTHLQKNLIYWPPYGRKGNRILKEAHVSQSHIPQFARQKRHNVIREPLSKFMTELAWTELWIEMKWKSP
jgi:hypothetical protein